MNKMSDINSVTILGRLTMDTELSYTPSNNTALAKFSIAVNGRKKDDPEDVSFFNIVVWDKMAEICAKYISKGSQVCIQGTLKQSRFTDKDGNKRSSVDIIANSVQFIGGKKDSSPGEQQKATSHNLPAKDDPFDNIDFNSADEEIPF